MDKCYRRMWRPASDIKPRNTQQGSIYPYQSKSENMATLDN